MGLEEIRRTYEKWARENPFHAVLTSERFRNAGEDPEEFFEAGRQEIARAKEYVVGLDVEPRSDRALDFGCGVGRLSQALAGHFERVDGVDIARPMVKKAREVNSYPDRVHYHLNTTDDLALFGDSIFDFVYSNITLQHVPPIHVESYIREFVRVLRPGGLALFQMPDGPRVEPGTLRAFLYKLKREHFRRFWKRIRGLPPYEMHYLARSRVDEVVAEAGGRMVEVRRMSPADVGRGLWYAVTR